MTRTPKNPAARSAPATRRVSPLEGEPPSVAPVTEGGGKMSPHGQDRERAGLAGMPTPETGVADPATQTAAPVRGRAPQAPVAAVPDETPGLSGAEWRAAAKGAQSRHNAAQRRGRVRRAPKATGPGMIRRLPPEPPQGAA